MPVIESSPELVYGRYSLLRRRRRNAPNTFTSSSVAVGAQEQEEEDGYGQGRHQPASSIASGQTQLTSVDVFA